MHRPILIILLLGLILLSLSSACSKKSTEPQTCALPTFNPVGGTYNTVAFVTISSETPDATIRYTIDGSEPSTNAFVYSNFITLLTTTTIKAQAVKSGWNSSEVATAVYVIE